MLNLYDPAFLFTDYTITENGMQLLHFERLFN